MILNPVVVRGETNYNYPHVYSCLFPAMIHDWRAKFQNPDMLFLFVQLAPSTQLGNFVGLRAAQMTALQLPQVGYSVAVDIGDISSPMGSIHPRRKQEVGRRLSLEARRLAYGASHERRRAVVSSVIYCVYSVLFWQKRDLKMGARRGVHTGEHRPSLRLSCSRQQARHSGGELHARKRGRAAHGANSRL